MGVAHVMQKMVDLRNKHSAKIWPRDNELFRLACDRIVVHHGVDQLHYALDRFGIGKNVKLYEEDCQRFYDVANAMIVLNFDYTLSFRWLLLDNTSNFLYEETDPVAVVNAISTGQVSDVSRNEVYESKFFNYMT